MTYYKVAQNPMCIEVKLDADLKGKLVDETLYKKLIENLIYLTSTRPDIIYAIRIISRYIFAPKESH